MADIVRTYHDVTKLDKGIALSKVKEVMDLSSGTEFFTVVKDPLSYAPKDAGDKELEYDGSHYSYSYYMKLGYTYIFKCTANQTFNFNNSGNFGTNNFTAGIRISKLEYESIEFADDTDGQKWREHERSIMRHARSVTLRRDNGDDEWYFYFSKSPQVDASSDVRDDWDYKIPANDLRVFEFKIFEKITGNFYPNDGYSIFEFFKRSFSDDDLADALFLTQKTPNHFTINISGLRYDCIDDLCTFMENAHIYNYRYYDTTLLKNALHDMYGYNMDDIDASVPSKYRGFMTIIGMEPSLNDGAFIYDRNKFEEYAVSGKEFILFPDVNAHAARFILDILQYMGIADEASYHTHESRQLFKNLTLHSLTHERNGYLFIGDPLNQGYIEIVEDTRFNGKTVSGIGALEDVGSITATSGNIATLSGSTLTFTNATVNGTLSTQTFAANTIGINQNEKRTVGANGTVNGMHLLVFDVTATNTNGTYAGIIRQTESKFNTTVNTALSGLSNSSSHQFLGVDGEFRTLTPAYLGASADTHGHGQITNDGKVTTNKATLVSNDRILIADSADGGRVKTGPKVNTDNNSNSTENYLSEAGTWQSFASMFYRGNLASANAINGACKIGLYKYKFSSGGYNFDNGIPRTAKYGNTALSTSGVILVLPNNGSTVTGSTDDGALMQLAYTNEYSANNTTYKTQVFVRNGVRNSTSGNIEWKSWIALAHTDHNHDGEYARVEQVGTRIVKGLQIYKENLATNIIGLYDNNNNDNYSITFTDTDSNSGDNVVHALTASTGEFIWNGNSTELMNLTYKVTGSGISDSDSKLQVWTNFEARANSTLTGKLYLSTASGATACQQIASSGDTANASVMLLSGAASNVRTVSYSDITGTQLYQLSGINTNETIQTQINKYYAHVKTDADNDAHGNIKSRGTITGTGVAIEQNDTLLIADASNNGKIEKAKDVAFDGSTTTSFLSKKGTWQALPGVWTLSGSTRSKTDGTITNGGLISKTDIEHLDTMWSVWQVDDNADTKINKIQEVLKAFENLEESTDLYNVIDGINTDISGKVSKSGDTMTGLLTAYTGGDKRGIKLDAAYLNALSGNIIFQSTNAIRFTDKNDWAYDTWAGLKYAHSDKTISLGLADGTVFTKNNAAQSGGTLQLPGIKTLKLYGTGNVNTEIYHQGTSSSNSMIRFLNNNSNANGTGISIGGGGLAVLGAGESATEVCSKGLSGTAPANDAEDLYLAADANIYILSNCDTYANRKSITIDTSGNLITNNGYLYSNGSSNKVVTAVSVSGTGLSGGVTAANATGTITLKSSSAGNASSTDYPVVLRNANGSIQTEKLAVSSGTTTKATMQYNSTEDCIEFIFA